jgi:hypothetical protein
MCVNSACRFASEPGTGLGRLCLCLCFCTVMSKCSEGRGRSGCRHSARRLRSCAVSRFALCHSVRPCSESHGATSDVIPDPCPPGPVPIFGPARYCDQAFLIIIIIIISLVARQPTNFASFPPQLPRAHHRLNRSFSLLPKPSPSTSNNPAPNNNSSSNSNSNATRAATLPHLETFLLNFPILLLKKLSRVSSLEANPSSSP